MFYAPWRSYIFPRKLQVLDLIWQPQISRRATSVLAWVRVHRSQTDSVSVVSTRITPTIRAGDPSYTCGLWRVHQRRVDGYLADVCRHAAAVDVVLQPRELLIDQVSKALPGENAKQSKWRNDPRSCSTLGECEQGKMPVNSPNSIATIVRPNMRANRPSRNAYVPPMSERTCATVIKVEGELISKVVATCW